MHTSSKKSYWPVKSLAAGLFSAQTLATLHVWFSNLSLHQSLTALEAQGYLIVPNALVMASLRDLEPAFLSGLLFTFTAGVGLSLTSISAHWITDHVFGRTKAAAFTLLCIWISVLCWMNSVGICLWPSLYVVLIPAATLYPALKRPLVLKGAGAPRFKAFLVLVPALPFVLLAGDIHKQRILAVRDNFLLSNPIGLRINDFYYRHTMFAAEAFRPPGSKLLKTCVLGGVYDQSLGRSIQDTLIGHDYLVLPTYEHADLNVRQKNGVLILKGKGGKEYKTAVNNFLQSPEQVLREYSGMNDTYRPFRRFIRACLLAGPPLLFYLLVFYSVHSLLRRAMGQRASWALTAVFCLLTGSALLLWVAHAQYGERHPDFFSLVRSHDWRERVLALKALQKKGLNVEEAVDHRSVLASPYVPERYWYARALGTSTGTASMDSLMTLLDDTHPNVVCMALDSLGRRKQTDATGPILKKIEESSHWYVQWYAYKAARDLGWIQTPCP